MLCERGRCSSLSSQVNGPDPRAPPHLPPDVHAQRVLKVGDSCGHGTGHRRGHARFQHGHCGRQTDSARYSGGGGSRVAWGRVCASQGVPQRLTENPLPLLSFTVVALLMEYIFAAQGLRIPSAAVDIISKNPFASLTGCPTECDYAVSSFPSTCSPIAIAQGTRTGALCAPPVGTDYSADLITNGAVPPSCASSPPPTFVQVAPSFFLTKACNPGFQAQLDSFDAITAAETESACPVAQAKALVAALAATTDSLTQAYAFRAFLLQTCVGDFNTLNTFNGFTATGFSGLFSPEGAEVVMSPFNTSFVPAWSKAEINFCINGFNSGQPVGTSCVG